MEIGNSDLVRVDISQLKSICNRILIALGHSESHAHLITDILIYAESSNNSQGLKKLFTKGSGSLSEPPPKNATPKIVFESQVAVRWDADHVSGMFIMYQAAMSALQKARTVGIGIASTFNSSSGTGAIGYYCEQIAKQGLIALVCSGSIPLVAPAGSREKLFGTNPIAYGIPLNKENVESAEYDYIVADLSTSSMAFWSLVDAKKKGQSLPLGTALKADGSNATEACDAEILLPFGGHKGSAISLLVEFLTGPFVGASFAGLDHNGGSNNQGNLILAIDPNIFGTGQQVLDDASRLAMRIRNSEPRDGVSSVSIPGDNSRRLRSQIERQAYLDLNNQDWDKLLELERTLKCQ